jgi:murein L,D-transpeptidase YcbB/YkuD
MYLWTYKAIPFLLFLIISVLLLSTVSFANSFSLKNIYPYPIKNPKDIERFYSETNGSYLWVDGGQLTIEAKEIIREIGSSWEYGLNPENYFYPRLYELAKNGVPKDREIETEVFLSDSFILYARDLSGMRLSPKELGEDNQSWSRGIDGYSLLKILSEKSDKSDLISQLMPQDDAYKKLSSELKLIAEDLAKNPEKNFKKVRYPGLLRPGAKNPAIISIRQKLGLEGSSDIYDEELKAHVEDFQRLNGLAPDGLIGQRSFDAINQTRTQKLIKLIANLERRRWVRRPIESRFIAVNIPQMQLQAVEDGRTVFEMPVIIGREKRPTNSFVDSIIGIRFNPRWYVPDTIKKEDFLPKLQADPNALAHKGIQFRIKTEKGMEKVASTEIDWSKMTEADLKSVQMYQDSGEKNALGLIRVLMPNKYDIYLHDTNEPALFAKDDRAISSGCVRVYDPRKIANFILGMNKDWSDKKIDTYISSHKLIEVNTVTPLPVYLFYFTAWLDENDRVVIANDVYGNDGRLVQALQAKGKIPFELGKIPKT